MQHLIVLAKLKNPGRKQSVGFRFSIVTDLFAP